MDSGDLTRQTVHGQNATFKFQPSVTPPPDVEHEDRPSAITRAIFALRFTRNQQRLSSVIDVGRHASTDIVVVDYSISKCHATFKMLGNKCIVVDRSSTNGTKINGERIAASVDSLVEAGDVLEIGRFGFMLMRPVDLFVSLRLHLGLQKTLEGELESALHLCTHADFKRLATDRGIDARDMDRKTLLDQLFERVPTEELLRGLL